MNTTVMSALMPDAWDSAIAAIAPVLARFETEVLVRVAEAGIQIKPLLPGERFSDASLTLRRKRLFVDEWPFPPAGLFIVAERRLYLRILTPMTIAHEFGHAIDCAFGDGDYLSARDPEIKDAFASARRFVSPYAAMRVDEYVAESVRAFVGGNDLVSVWPHASRRLLAEIDPKMHAILERLIGVPVPVA